MKRHSAMCISTTQVAPYQPSGRLVSNPNTKFHLRTLHLAFDSRLCGAYAVRRRGQTSGVYEATHDTCGESRNIRT